VGLPRAETPPGPAPAPSSPVFPDPGPLVLDGVDASVQPFLRCAACERDQHRQATQCALCGADLTTDAQRAYNATLWERLQSERDAARPEEAIPHRVLTEARQRQEEEQQSARDREAQRRWDGRVWSWLSDRIEEVPPPVRQRARRGVVALCAVAFFVAAFARGGLVPRLLVMLAALGAAYTLAPARWHGRRQDPG
jgi:hypothetical protein